MKELPNPCNGFIPSRIAIFCYGTGKDNTAVFVTALNITRLK
jgi:hypothetical protein